MKPTRHKIASYISEQSLGGKLSHKNIEELAAYLIETGRTNDVASILRDVDELWAENGVIEVHASSARKLSPKLQDEIKHIVRQHYPKAKRIEIMEQLVPELIGGVRLEFANKLLDLSIRTEIDKFKQVALAGRD